MKDEFSTPLTADIFGHDRDVFLRQEFFGSHDVFHPQVYLRLGGMIQDTSPSEHLGLEISPMPPKTKDLLEEGANGQIAEPDRGAFTPFSVREEEMVDPPNFPDRIDQTDRDAGS